MNQSQDKVEELLNQVLKFKTNERGAFLVGACGGDPDLLERVLTLLRAAEGMEGFMEGITTLDENSFSEGPGV